MIGNWREDEKNLLEKYLEKDLFFSLQVNNLQKYEFTSLFILKSIISTSKLFERILK